MEQNKSLSARIKRRNKQGFAGVGSYCGVGPNHSYGDYTDPEQNGKAADYAREQKRKAADYAIEQKRKAAYYAIEQKRKNKLGFKLIAKGFSINKRALTKKYADKHQKLN